MVSPRSKQQSQSLQQGNYSGQNECWGGHSLLSDEWLKETGQGESQKHGAAQQHVQERTECWAGKCLHCCLALHLGGKK